MGHLMLDHLAVSGEDRDAARAYIEAALGVKMQSGGEHARFGTHNHLMGLNDGLYLEAISIDPKAPKPDRPRWFNLDHFSGAPRLTNWICATSNMADALAKWPEAGGAVALERGALGWEMAVPETGALPFDGMFPPLITWHGTLHPAQMLNESGVALTQLSVIHPLAAKLSERLGTISGALVRFEIAEEPALVAEFATPHGPRVLS